MPKLFALLGMPGSGKDVAEQHLTNIFHFKTIHFGGLTIKTLEEENREITPENEREVRERLRRDHGPAAYATLNLPTIVEALTHDVVINGLYSWEEYKVLKGRFHYLVTIAIWAPPELRYLRLAGRPVRPLTREEAMARDYAEIENLAKGGPLAMADYMVLNTGSMENLYAQIERICGELGV